MKRYTFLDRTRRRAGANRRASWSSLLIWTLCFSQRGNGMLASTVDVSSTSMDACTLLEIASALLCWLSLSQILPMVCIICISTIFHFSQPYLIF